MQRNLSLAFALISLGASGAVFFTSALPASAQQNTQQPPASSAPTDQQVENALQAGQTTAQSQTSAIVQQLLNQYQTQGQNVDFQKQTGLGSAMQLVNAVLFTLNPPTPAPGQQVTVTASNSLLPLTTADVTWSLNGIEKAHGTGLTSFTFTMGEIGQQTTVDMSATTQDGIPLEKSVTLNPGIVDIIWEAHTTVPPFYRGKALPSHQSSVTLTALPSIVGTGGASVPASSLVYTWKKDNQALGNLSGYGAQTINVPGGLLDHASTYSVNVSTLAGFSGAGGETGGSITYDPNITPFVLFYVRSPLDGVLYGHALGQSASIGGKSAIIRAEPYYFSADDLYNNGTFSWQLNGQPVGASGGLTNEVTFSGGNGGTAAVSLDINIPGLLFQNGSGQVMLTSAK